MNILRGALGEVTKNCTEEVLVNWTKVFLGLISYVIKLAGSLHCNNMDAC